MIRSTNEILGEYDLIRHREHIAKVWATIEARLPRYWRAFVDAEGREDRVAELAAKFGKPVAAKTRPEGHILTRVFDDALASYEKEAQKYRRFLGPEALEEFQDDPHAFKQTLSKDVPIIANTLRHRSAELREWQQSFRTARPKVLLEVFSNVMDFLADWSEAHPEDRYVELDELEDFGLDPFDHDETMSLVGVIGMGIKSIVLYHLDPQRLPARGRNALYALYFLSNMDDFGLPSRSSEFLMVNDVHPTSDGSIIMDQNFWYPYGLFSLYALRTFRWIEQCALNADLALDSKFRYVYVERFFQAVCAQHADDLRTMRAYERFEVPG